MNTCDDKDVRYVMYAFGLFSLFIVGSIIMDFKKIDIFYLIVLITCLLRHRFLRKKKRDCT